MQWQCWWLDALVDRLYCSSNSWCTLITFSILVASIFCYILFKLKKTKTNKKNTIRSHLIKCVHCRVNYFYPGKIYRNILLWLSHGFSLFIYSKISFHSNKLESFCRKRSIVIYSFYSVQDNVPVLAKTCQEIKYLFHKIYRCGLISIKVKEKQ